MDAFALRANLANFWWWRHVAFDPAAFNDCEEDSPASHSHSWESRTNFLQSLSTFEPYLDLVDRVAI